LTARKGAPGLEGSLSPLPKGSPTIRPSGLGSRWFGPERCEFLVWAPSARKVELRLVSPKKTLVAMESDGSGYHWAVLSGLKPGTEYLYRLDGKAERPDPASRRQPRGVHGPSAVADPAFSWHDRNWKGLPLERAVIYELHVGAFSRAGDFAGVVPRLDTLAELGVTTLCLMPVAQFPGTRNWGYDGVYPFAVQDCYGGTAGLKRLIDAAHLRGLAVMLDVVYSHLGPEGNYLRDFGPYFTGRTPWGEAVNLDGAGSDEVRRFFIESALRWLDEFHVDGLRLDAVHAWRDSSARPFAEELAHAAHGLSQAQGRRVHIIAESVLNDPRIIRPSAEGGWGCDAQWSKDFHHALHSALTGERAGYYADFSGLADLARAYRDAFVYVGQYSSWRRRSHGRSAQGLPASRFVVYAQDHDEAGNRPQGERLSTLVDFEALKLAAAAVALSPYLPLLFMGEEYGERAPFFYFTSHGDRGLAAAVRQGRGRMFDSFAWHGKTAPDPNAAATFSRCKLDDGLRRKGRHARLQDFYRRLYALRREHPALVPRDRDNLDVEAREETRALVVRRRAGAEEAFFVLHFGKQAGRLRLELAGGRWAKLLDSAQPQWGGPGSPAAERLAGGPVELSLAPLCVVVYGRSPALDS
jgi:maltooligosyltrehalose trehalohydrolase